MGQMTFSIVNGQTEECLDEDFRTRVQSTIWLCTVLTVNSDKSEHDHQIILVVELAEAFLVKVRMGMALNTDEKRKVSPKTGPCPHCHVDLLPRFPT